MCVECWPRFKMLCSLLWFRMKLYPWQFCNLNSWHTINDIQFWVTLWNIILDQSATNNAIQNPIMLLPDASLYCANTNGNMPNNGQKICYYIIQSYKYRQEHLQSEHNRPVTWLCYMVNAPCLSVGKNQRILQLYTAKSQYWLHKAGASPEQWQLKTDNFTYEIFNENIK